jgi:hypothetical protein
LNTGHALDIAGVAVLQDVCLQDVGHLRLIVLGRVHNKVRPAYVQRQVAALRAGEARKKKKKKRKKKEKRKKKRTNRRTDERAKKGRKQENARRHMIRENRGR